MEGLAPLRALRTETRILAWSTSDDRGVRLYVNSASPAPSP